MWIWQLSRAGHGNPSAIARTAHRYRVQTLIIKGSDGRRRWSQFSRSLVRRLKAAGLHVCAYQFVYGAHPGTEANIGVRLARAGADCILIDAEGDYEGRYWQAQFYIRRLRARLGPDYPLALAGFPYVHYHPGYPYSVFLGPGGAQLNVPQVYWKAIGTSVDNALSVTYRYNRIYGRPIVPLGQVYDRPPTRQIRRFRLLSAAYGAQGVSWWSWQHATRGGWRAISAPLSFNLLPPPPRYPTLKPGMRGDLVVWAQQHLLAAGEPVRVTGVFSRAMRKAVVQFQSLVGLPAAGRIGPGTWQALMAHPAAAVSWSRRGTARAVSAAAGRSAPLSAKLPAVRNELGHHPH
jgi:Putative peptidoglycan binding domain